MEAFQLAHEWVTVRGQMVAQTTLADRFAHARPKYYDPFVLPPLFGLLFQDGEINLTRKLAGLFKALRIITYE